MTKTSSTGERRFCESFDIRLSTLAEATIDILFSKEKVSERIYLFYNNNACLSMLIQIWQQCCLL